MNFISDRVIPTNQITAAWRNRQSTRLWDRVEFWRWPQSFQFFIDPVGSMCRYRCVQKTMIDTNMTGAMQLPAPRCILVDRVTFTFNREASEQDVYAIAESFMFRLRVDEKFIVMAPLIALHTEMTSAAPIRICTFCQSVYAVAEQCPGCGAREFRFLAGGGESRPGRRFFMELAFPLYIGPLMQFVVEMIGTGREVQKPGISLWCHLDGEHDAALS